MPTNILEGNSVQFVVEFLSSDTGLRISPSSASVTINYHVSGVATSTTIDLTANGGFYTATWSTAGADLGSVTYTTESSDTTNPASTGEIRIIDP